ncbi:MAG: biotin/lipoate A/B protein ligase family protein [Candidatus Lokiarchaeia archaeon]
MSETFWKREDGKTTWDEDEAAYITRHTTWAEFVIIAGASSMVPKGTLPPAFLLWLTWKKDNIIFPYFASPDYDVNLKYCEDHDIAVEIRCPYGGGVSWVDKGAPASCIGLDRDHPSCPPTLEEMYRKIFTGAAKEIGEVYGLKTRYKPLNDVEVMCDDGKWRKISIASGISSQGFMGSGYVIQLSPVPWDIVDKIITPPPEKFADKETKTLRDRSIDLNEMVGREISIEEFQGVMKDALSKAFDVTPVPTTVDWEKIPAYNMAKGLLSSEGFFYNRAERMKFADTPIVEGVGKGEARVKIPQGPFVRATALVKDDKLYNILITGTLHAAPMIPESPVDVMERELKDAPADEKIVLERVKKIYDTEGYEIPNISPEQFTELIMRAVKIAKSND